jgi:hypothetical protein
MVHHAHIIIASVLLLLTGCMTAIPLQVQEYNNIKFSRGEKIYIEAGDEVVKISSRLKNELTRAGFRMAESRKDAGYIIFFEYKARFDVYPWVITSFSLKMAHARSGDVIYNVSSARTGKEKTDSVIRRIVDDMSSRLLTKEKRGQVAIIVTDTEKKAAATNP